MTVNLQFTKQQVKAWFKLLSDTRKELTVARYDHKNHRLVFTDGCILLEVPTAGWDDSANRIQTLVLASSRTEIH